MKFTKTLAAATALALGLGGAAIAQTKAGFIYVGPPTDFGWSYEHDQGRLAVEEAFGDAVETSFVASVLKVPMLNA